MSRNILFNASYDVHFHFLKGRIRQSHTLHFRRREDHFCDANAAVRLFLKLINSVSWKQGKQIRNGGMHSFPIKIIEARNSSSCVFLRIRCLSLL